MRFVAGTILLAGAVGVSTVAARSAAVPPLNKKKRVIGNRIVVLQQTALNPTPGVAPKLVTVAVADGWLTRSGGGIKYDPTMCGRNMYP